MTWKKISDIKVVCKRCNLGMVFESSLNDTNIILVCNKCKDHVNIEMKGDGTHGVGMPPPSKDKKRCDLGGIIKRGVGKHIGYTVLFDTIEEAREYKNMDRIILKNDGYDVKVHRGYLDEKEEG